MSSTCPWYPTIRLRSLKAATVISPRRSFSTRKFKEREFKPFRSPVKRVDYFGCRPAGRWLCRHVAHWNKEKSTPVTKRHFNHFAVMHPNDGKVIYAKIAPRFFFHPSLLLAHLLLAFHRFTRTMANAPGATTRGVGWINACHTLPQDLFATPISNAWTAWGPKQ